VSDWVAGIATAVAVVVALVFSLRTERHQRDQILAAVHAWFELIPPTATAGPRGILKLVNDTACPVYQWHVDVQWHDNAGAAEVHVGTGELDHGLLPPGRHDFPLEAVDLELPTNDAAVEVELHFRDAEGRMRHRLSTGRLVSGGR
jgi:hypothetical protein